jgi:hypothetical protein
MQFVIPRISCVNNLRTVFATFVGIVRSRTQAMEFSFFFFRYIYEVRCHRSRSQPLNHTQECQKLQIGSTVRKFMSWGGYAGAQIAEA